MSFKQCLELPSEYLAIRAKILRVSQRLAAALQADRTYGTDALLSICADSEYGSEVIEALCSIGVITRTDYIECSRCDLPSEYCICATPAEQSITLYEVIGDLMRLLEEAHTAQPYFISFYTAEAVDEATALHNTLRNAGINGFLSAEDLGSGDQWRTEIISNLRRSQVFFCLETPAYHTRSRCRIERDFAVASGMRVVRIVLCDPQQLRDPPPFWNGDIEHDRFTDSAGRFMLGDKLLGIALPARLGLAVRKQGARMLLNGAPADIIRDMASQLDILAYITDSGTPAHKKTEFLETVYGAESLADRFCEIVELALVF